MTDAIDEDEGNSRIDAAQWQIAERRRRTERQGVSYRDLRWHGDAEGRQSVTEAIAAAEAHEAEHGGGSWSTAWKCMDGWLDDCTLADLRAVRDLLAERRRACFARERELLLALHAGNSYDIGAGWPQ